MIRPIRWLALLPLLLALSAAASVIELYRFSDPALEARYQQLIAELRCPKCQNQNLAGSDSAIAADLRREVRELLEAGASDEEIKAYLTDRYGVFVLYRPPLAGSTLLVWIIPGLLIATGIGVAAYVVVRNRKRRPAGPAAPPMTADDEEEWL